MAVGWIDQIMNFSGSDFTVQTNDRTWRPVINGHQYAVDERIPVRRAYRAGEVVVIPAPFPGAPEIRIPMMAGGPHVLDVDFAMIGWADFARTRITGPGGYVDVVIGPTGVSDRDYLRIFDEQMNEVGSIEMGPRGGGHVASVDFKLIIRDDSIRFLWWSSSIVGAQLLERFDKIMTVLGTQLAGKLIGGIPIPK